MEESDGMLMLNVFLASLNAIGKAIIVSPYLLVAAHHRSRAALLSLSLAIIEVNKSFGKYCQYLSKFLRMLIGWGVPSPTTAPLLHTRQSLDWSSQSKDRLYLGSSLGGPPLFCWKAQWKLLITLTNYGDYGEQRISAFISLLTKL